MERKGWSICDFIFQYEGLDYIVLVKRFVGHERKVHPYALVKLHFMKSNNLHDELQVEANVMRLLGDAKELREYFGIAYSHNLGDILNHFSQNLGRFIPRCMPDPSHLTDLEKSAMVRSLSKSDSEDPQKIYCMGIKRNPPGRTRSVFHTDKTKLLRKDLYDAYANDPSISFCYSADKNKKTDDATVHKEFACR